MNVKRIIATQGDDTLFFQSIVDAAIYFKTTYKVMKEHLSRNTRISGWLVTYAPKDNIDNFVSVDKNYKPEKKSRFSSPLLIECRYDDEFIPNICPFCGLVGVRWSHIAEHIDGRPYEYSDCVLKIYDYEKT